MTTAQDRLQIAADKSELLDLLYRYCRAIDRRDMDLLRTVYHPDATDNHGGYYNGPVDGFFEVVPASLEPFALTQHMIANALFVVDGDRAEGESYLIANHMPKDDPYRSIFAIARYLDVFERRNGEWRIFERTCVLDWDSEGGMDPGAISGKPDAHDPSYRHLHLLAALADGATVRTKDGITA